METTEANYSCAYCGETIELVVDPSGGRVQEYVEDCWVCCRPNKLRVSIDSEGDATVAAEAES